MLIPLVLQPVNVPESPAAPGTRCVGSENDVWACYAFVAHHGHAIPGFDVAQPPLDIGTCFDIQANECFCWTANVGFKQVEKAAEECAARVNHYTCVM